MNLERIVVLGVGNILLKDEGVGVRVAEELQRRYMFPEHVSVIDGGTQGLWLMPTIQETDHLIVIDAVLGGGEPARFIVWKGRISRAVCAPNSPHTTVIS